MATYALTIAGDPQEMQLGWSLAMTANGRDSLTCEVLSKDGTYRPAMAAVTVLSELVVISTSSAANPTHIITAEAHGIVSGQTVTVAGHSDAGVNGARIATRVSATEFTLPVASGGGTGGTVARRLIGGRINKPAERGLGGEGLVPITTRIEVVDYAEDAKKRRINEVLVASNLKTRLERICTLLGWTIHPSQPVDALSLAALPCDYATAEAVLNTLTTLTGYVWEKDPFDRLRMFLPNTEAAPVNVIDGNGVAIGDVTVEPTRNNYANKITLRFTKDAIASWGFLTTSGNFSSGELVILGGQTYQFRTVLTDVAGYVLLGGSATDSLGNLAAAITLGAGSGVAYAAATIVHASATGYVYGGTQLKAIALTPGASGNSIACSTTGANASWIGEGGGGIAALALGSDAALSNVSIATDASFATDPCEDVVDSPTTTSQAAADVLSAAVLAVRLIQPKMVTYETDAIGLRPGQTQTITVAARGLTGTHTITDIVSAAVSGTLVRWAVTAVQSLLVQAADRWQAWWTPAAGSVSGGSVTVGGGGVVVGSGQSIVDFGGSTIEQWPAPAANGLVPANATQRYLNTAARGALVGTCYVRVRASSGSVTAYLWDVTTGAAVGTSAAVTNASYEWASFGVVLTAGTKLYDVRLSGSVEGAELNLGASYLE